METRFLLAVALAAPVTLTAANHQLLGWNNLGMHCMDSDYSVFSILPPYNTIHANLIASGKLVTSGGYTVTYQAVADPDGSFNSTSRGKGNYHDYCLALYGAPVAVDQGLPFPGPETFWMPGANNTPQAMKYETNLHWFAAYGVPITPYDDARRRNPYPMMRLIAWNGAGTAIATNDIVLPVSDEMDCRACHASGAGGAARPSAGWVWSSNPERDFRLNILRLHDERQFAQYAGLYQAALAARGFNAQGLYRGVVADGKPVLCASCHASEALGAGSYSNIPPLTASVHAKHALVNDPDLGLPLDNAANRAACYRCHPGSATKCLRGAMGGAIAADGTMAMQCQSCHGSMSAVGSTNRTGWLMESTCQSCHTGTAASNNGKIRFTSCFEANGAVRVAVNQTFATSPNTPAPSLSLYRFSTGHGGLQCSACHGSTHAEFPTTHRNDNVRNERIQGHAGMMVECTSCHVSMAVSAASAAGGPHGLHPVGQAWADNHGDLLEGSPALRARCAGCHGADGKGTVLSRMQNTRVIPTKENKYGTKNYWRGRTVSCYDCHNGPNSTDPSSQPQAVVQSLNASTTGGVPVNVTLQATGGGAMTYRVVSQPAHGSVGVSNGVATYFPEAGYTGADQFTFAAWNGWVDSNLATGSVAVAQGTFSIKVAACVPPSWPTGWPAPFGAVGTPVSTAAAVAYDWDFGDGSAHGADQHASHAYAAPGAYQWTLVARASTAQASVTGSITIAGPMLLTATGNDGQVSVAWPKTLADAVLEQTPLLPVLLWKPSTNTVLVRPESLEVSVPSTAGGEFYRLRLVQ